jgi:hypothetical protein
LIASVACARTNWTTKSCWSSTRRGLIRFAGQRAFLLDAVAMGLLRKYVVENFGLLAARTVLTQFGFAHAGAWQKRCGRSSSGTATTTDPPIIASSRVTA